MVSTINSEEGWSIRNKTDLTCGILVLTAISRKVVGKMCTRQSRNVICGYDQYTVPDTLAVEPTFVAFL